MREVHPDPRSDRPPRTGPAHDGTDAFVRRLPGPELHVHIEGTL
jgi:hypothetical protein